MRRKVVSAKNLPVRSPILPTAAWSTILHYWGAPGWAYGVVGVFIVVGWIIWICDTITNEPKEVF